MRTDEDKMEDLSRELFGRPTSGIGFGESLVLAKRFAKREGCVNCSLENRTTGYQELWDGICPDCGQRFFNVGEKVHITRTFMGSPITSETEYTVSSVRDGKCQLADENGVLTEFLDNFMVEMA